MHGILMLINQYGFEADIFERHRETVRQSNNRAVKVLGIAGVIDAVMMTAFGVLRKQPVSGLWVCIFLLLAGVAGIIVSFRPGSSGTALLISGYLVSAGFYILAVYGSVIMDTDAFWIGTQVAVGCFLLDYAWRAGLLQLLSYAALWAAWMVSGAEVDNVRIFFSALFFTAGLVTFYTVNRTRVSMIFSRAEYRRQADTDLLTGLTVRLSAQQEIEDHLKTGGQGMLMLLNLDRFRNVNDRLGYRAGDDVLADVAADLKKVFRSSDVLSRLGADEFVVYLKNVPEKDQALQRASQVVREIRRWVGNGTTNLQITASAGVVTTDMVARTYDDLYRAADIAMFTAKHEGGNRAMLYSREMLDQRETGESPAQKEMPGREDGIPAARDS